MEVTEKEGPRIMIKEEDRAVQKYIRDIEKTENSCQEYDNRIKDDIRHTLKECGGEGKTFSEEQKKLMVWYTYFFLNRGKPSTHT